MGVYGYGATEIAIPEGYLPIKVENGDQVIHRETLYPVDPGSVYHLIKTQDQLLFAFYNNDMVRITDLHQGIVWGTQTEETLRDERLIDRFDYDGDYGTVLNRFSVQAVIGYPLTVHGSGRQTRAFITLRNSVRCVELAILNPPKKGERVRIFNQMTEAFALIDLAQMIATLTGRLLNDDQTTMEFVVRVLEEIFGKDRETATRIMLEAHSEGFGACGIYPYDIAEAKVTEVLSFARRHVHPLQCVLERSLIYRAEWRIGFTAAA
jgi:ATP-dependent Clp protease adapter protein ClpS